MSVQPLFDIDKTLLCKREDVADIISNPKIVNRLSKRSKGGSILRVNNHFSTNGGKQKSSIVASTTSKPSIYSTAESMLRKQFLYNVGLMGENRSDND